MNELATITQIYEPVETDVIIAMDRNPMAVFLIGQAPSSRYTYKGDLQGISSILGYQDPFKCPWGELRFQHTQAIRTILIEDISIKTGKNLAVATINRKISALRGVLKTAWRLGQIDAENYHRAIDIENVKGESVPAGRELTNTEITRLMNACEKDDSPNGARDAAIIAIMYTCGLRRNEVTHLELVDYDPSSEKIIVSGKRRKERTAYLVNEAALAMAEWLKFRGENPGPLFLPFNGRTHKLFNRRMTNEVIYYMLLKRGKQAGLKRFSPHDMRRTFVSDLLEAGVDIATVSKMAGHSNITTTARYDKRPETTKKDATKLLHITYHQRRVRENE